MLLKIIRENRNKIKIETYTDILSPPSVRQVESDIEKIRLGDLYKVLNNLEITIEEFIYYSNINNKSQNNNELLKIRNINNYIKQNDINNLMKYYENQLMYYYTLRCINGLLNNNMKDAHEYASLTWFYLKEYDQLFANELFCLSHIFILFKGDQFEEVCRKIQKDLRKWRAFEDFLKVEIVFLLNKGRYLEEIKRINEAKECYREAHTLALKEDLATYTGISIFRLGKLNNDESLIIKGQTILEIFNKDVLETLHQDYNNKII